MSKYVSYIFEVIFSIFTFFKFKMKKKLVVLTGAGISAESGISTFRDANGLWEGHNIMDVASPQGWNKNPELVLDFYNKRRQQLHTVKPNVAHLLLAELEQDFDVHIITQNVDNLHEQAGSSNVLHLHGELFKVRSTKNENHILDWKTNLNIGDCDANGYQLRPHIVWFGEAVPMLNEAIKITEKADIFAVIGTSMQVYPAASLIEYTPQSIPLFYIDKNPAILSFKRKTLETISMNATQGVAVLKEKISHLK
jgi:NAD-dependent deacetylase